MKKNRRDWAEVNADYFYLTEAGFSVKKYSPIHWRAFKGDKAVDIWPTARKYMPSHGGGAVVYSHIQEAIDKIHQTGVPTPEADIRQSIEAFSLFKEGLNEKLKSLGL